VTQTDLILDYMRKGNSITSMEALNMFGCFRLASRISELKQHGIDIEVTTTHSGGKHYASYRVKEKEDLFSVGVLTK
jgi:hypothetical protein